MQSDKVVRVTRNGSGLPVPDQDPVTAKKDNQKIRWCADFDIDIRVEGYTELQKATGGGDCAFRVTSGTFPNVTQYKYTIIDVGTGQENDPEIDILP